MKLSKNFSDRAFNIALYILAALAGYLLTACDGTGQGTDVPPSCDGANVTIVIPSASIVPKGGMTVADDVKKLCTGWSASKQYASNAACVAALAPTLTESVATAECGHIMTAAECADAANDFLDAAGVKHCLGTTPNPGYGNNVYVTKFGGFFVGSNTNSWPRCTAKPGGTYEGRSCIF